MSDLPTFRERLRDALNPTDRGVVGFVDQLLAFCRKEGATFEWAEGRCRCQPLAPEGGEAAELSLRRADFRHVLARIAAMCNERTQGSVSPYGGEGVLTEPASGDALRVRFTNSQAAQNLEVRRWAEDAPPRGPMADPVAAPAAVPDPT